MLVAVLMGAVLPWALLVAVAGARDPIPPPCSAGGGSLVAAPGQLVYSFRDALWVSSSDLGHPRRLVDYGPARRGLETPSPSPALSPAFAATPSAAASSAASATPSGAPGESPSPSPSPPPAVPLRFLAAALSPDLSSVAFLVTSPPGSPGAVSLRLAPLAATSGAAAVEAWTGTWPGGSRPATVQWLSPASVLFTVPSVSGAGPTGRLVGVVNLAPTPTLAESAPEAEFLGHLHGQWAETRSLRLPSALPLVADRIDGPGGLVAGRTQRELKTPLTSRRLEQLVTGHDGSTSTTMVCSPKAGMAPAAFSPDGRQLAVVDGDRTVLVQLGGPGAVAALLGGRLLDWAPPTASTPPSPSPVPTSS